MDGATLAGLEAMEVPAGAALDAIDAAPVDAAIMAELPVMALPLIIDEASMEEPIIEEPIIEEPIIEEAMDEPGIVVAMAAEDAVAELPAPPPPTDDAHMQTAAAEVCTASPVVGPQVASTHPNAALLMAALLAATH